MAEMDLGDYLSRFDWFYQESISLSDHVNEAFLTKRKRDRDCNSKVY